jgi:chromosome partitioning protein
MQVASLRVKKKPVLKSFLLFMEQLRERSGRLVYHTVIRENIRLAECPSFGRPITQYDPQSAGVADYRALAREIISQEGS